jgi:hypothetical protein
MILLCLLNFLSTFFDTGIIRPNDSFVNTEWVCNISKGCVDSYKFKSASKVAFYSCESDYTSYGTYSVSNDTLIVSGLDNSIDGSKEKYREMFLIGRYTLKPISTEELIKGRWRVLKVKFDSMYIFKKKATKK